jgi:hypothetical protein
VPVIAAAVSAPVVPAAPAPGSPLAPAHEAPLSAAVIVGSCGQTLGSSAAGHAGSPAAILAASQRPGGTTTSQALRRPDADLVVDTTSDPGSRPD